MGATVTTIPDDLFARCSQLETVTIGGRVATIGNRAFQGCHSLSRLIFNDGDTPLSLGCDLYEPAGVGHALFYDNPIRELYLGRELRYPETIYSGYAPFYRKETLSQVTLGKGVTTVGPRLFYGCAQLRQLVVEGTLTHIGAYAFYGCGAKL